MSSQSSNEIQSVASEMISTTVLMQLTGNDCIHSRPISQDEKETIFSPRCAKTAGMLMIRDASGQSRPATGEEYRQLIKSTSSLTVSESKRDSESESAGVVGHTGSSPDPYVNENIRLTDSDGAYNVYHYVQCDEQSPDSVKNSRGVIRKGDRVVCKTFNYTPEYVVPRAGATNAEILAIIGQIDQACSYYVAEEGTLVRLWFDNHSWHISTHKKLDAYHSRWGSRESHGELFYNALSWYVKNRLDGKVQFASDEEIIDNYTATLRQDRIYTFVVRSSESNRVVCDPPEHPMLFFAGEFDSNFTLLSENTSQIERPEKLSGAGEALEYVSNLDPRKAQGVLIYYGEDTPTFGSIKLTSAAYQELSDVRGNFPSIRFRYLQVRNDPDMADKLVKLYPSYAQDFADYETIIQMVAEVIYQGYIGRFIRHEFVTLPQELWYVAKSLHEAYVEDPVNNRITRDLVLDHLDSLSAVRLNFIIRAFKARESEDAAQENSESS